jgi:internalin A
MIPTQLRCGLSVSAALALFFLSLGYGTTADDGSKGPAAGAPVSNNAHTTVALGQQGPKEGNEPKKVNEPAATMPAELVAAWTKVGAEVGWMVVDKWGRVGWSLEGKKGAVPAFSLIVWTDDVVVKLPQPERAFGLNLGGTPVRDAGLKELARLKSLQALVLYSTKVTDAGLKELTRLEGLQELSLDDTQLTDAGLKALAELKGLQKLDLSSTPVTDAGLKELAGLKGLRLLDLRSTKVTFLGVTPLGRALPTCAIKWR